MDSQTEQKFLDLITPHSSIILSKSNIPAARMKRLSTWNSIASDLNVGRTVELTGEKLQKRWRNMVQRVKEKQTKMKSTGGGPSIKLSDNDQKILQLLGENNPQISRIPMPLSVGFQSKENVDPDPTTDKESDGLDQNNTCITTTSQLPERRKTNADRLIELEEKRLAAEEKKIEVLSEIRDELRQIRNALIVPSDIHDVLIEATESV